MPFSKKNKFTRRNANASLKKLFDKPPKSRRSHKKHKNTESHTISLHKKTRQFEKLLKKRNITVSKSLLQKYTHLLSVMSVIAVVGLVQRYEAVAARVEYLKLMTNMNSQRTDATNFLKKLLKFMSTQDQNKIRSIITSINNTQKRTERAEEQNTEQEQERDRTRRADNTQTGERSKSNTAGKKFMLQICEPADGDRSGFLTIEEESAPGSGLYSVFVKIYYTEEGRSTKGKRIKFVILSTWTGTEAQMKDELESTAKKNGYTITKAYRQLALLHHPDKGGDADVFKVLNEVHTRLKGQNRADM